jgi:hypothetical protein
MRMFPVLSLVFVGLFVVIAIGSVATGLAYDGVWYGDDLSTWTYSSMLHASAVMLATLLLVAVLRIRQLESDLRTEWSDPQLDERARAEARGSVWRIAAGPLILTVLLMAVSAIMLPLSTDFADANFRLNNTLVLFVSYSAALLPSYVVVATIALLGLPEAGEDEA